MRLLTLLFILAGSAAFSQAPKFIGVATSDLVASGRIFQFRSDGSDYNLVKTFGINPDGEVPVGTLTPGTDGDMYGVMSQGGSGRGTFYKIKAADDSFIKLFDFPGPEARRPMGALELAPNGFFYGYVVNSFDASKNGIYRIKEDGSDYSFLTPVAGTPGSLSGLTYYNNFLYGIAPTGGINGDGEFFRITLDGNLETLFTFQRSTSGKNPTGSLLRASNGMFYGVTTDNINGRSTIFGVNENGTGFGVVREITEFLIEGSFAGLLETAHGLLIGVSSGNIFRVKPDGSGFVSQSYALRRQIIKSPNGFLSIGNQGIIYSWNSDGENPVDLYELGSANGTSPLSISLHPNGVLYGLASEGGYGNMGTIFKLDTRLPSRKATLVRNISQENNGQSLCAHLALLPNGDMVGTTLKGGTSGRGTIFRMRPDGSDYKIIFNFGDQDLEGDPVDAPTVGPDGFLYSITSIGNIFRIDQNGNNFKKLYSHFHTYGVYRSPLHYGVDGALYGVCNYETYYSDVNGYVFKINADGTGRTKVHQFNSANGSHPATKLIDGSDGYLYSSTQLGGSNHHGTLFRIKADGSDFSSIF